jgi:predicted metal-dependent hydrolase
MLRNAIHVMECTRAVTDRELGKRDKKKKEKKLQGFCGLAFVCDLHSRAISDFFADDCELLPCGT